MYLNDLSLHRRQVEQSHSASVMQPTAALAGIQKKLSVFGGVDHFVRVAGDDHVGGGVVGGFEPVDEVVHDDRPPAEFDGQRTFDDARQHRLEALAFAVIVAVHAVQRRCEYLRGDELGRKGRDEITGVEDRFDLQPLVKSDRPAESRQPIMRVGHNSDFHG